MLSGGGNIVVVREPRKDGDEDMRGRERRIKDLMWMTCKKFWMNHWR